MKRVGFILGCAVGGLVALLMIALLVSIEVFSNTMINDTPYHLSCHVHDPKPGPQRLKPGETKRINTLDCVVWGEQGGYLGCIAVGVYQKTLYASSYDLLVLEDECYPPMGRR